MATLASMIVNVLANTSGFASAMKGVRGELKTLNEMGDDVSTKMGYVSTALAAIGAGFVAHKVIGDLGAVAEEIDNLAKVADRLGVSTEVFKGLEYGAGLAGVSSESLAGSLQFLSKQIGEAVHGGGKAKVVFDELGLSANKLSKLTADNQLRVIASALGNVENEAERTRMALRMFGGDGASMLTFLAEGEAGIKKYMVEAEKLGLTYSREEAAKVEAFNDAWETLSKTLGGISKDIVIRLAPGATQAIKDLTEAVQGAKAILSDKNVKSLTSTAIGMMPGMSGSGIATGATLGTMATIKGLPQYGGLAGGLLNSGLLRLGVARTAGAFTDKELGANAARFKQFADGLPSDAALSYVNEQRFQQSIFGMVKKVTGGVGSGGTRLQEGFKSLSGFVDSAKEFGASWQRSWAAGQILGRKGDSAIDSVFAKRDTEAQVRGLKFFADKLGLTKGLGELRKMFTGGGSGASDGGRFGINSPLIKGTMEAARLELAQQNKPQKQILDESRKHTTLLTKITEQLRLQVTGV